MYQDEVSAIPRIALEPVNARSMRSTRLKVLKLSELMISLHLPDPTDFEI